MKRIFIIAGKPRMKRILMLILMPIIIAGLAVYLLGSSSESKSDSLPQTVTVQRGDLTIDISAAGNLALSVTEDLAFEIPGRVEEITVEEILVEEGDYVEKGQLLAKVDTSEWNDMLRDLEQDLLQAQISLENAEYALDKAEEGTLTNIDTDEGVKVVEIVDDWQVEIKEMQVELAQGSLEDSLKALEEALEKSPEIIAPFDGYITAVNIEGGDEVLTGTVAVELADPDRFEADILVSEMDIMQVKLGGKAWVEVDAMSGVRLPAEVTHISPTATIQSGVVNYDVKVELEPLEAVIEEQQEQGSETGQVSTVIPEDFQLREGLTVTVSLVVEEKTDILLLPNGVITTQGGQTYVQVLLPDNTIEERAITTGITDYVNTEITEGLSEGEEVIVPQGTTYTSTTTEQQEDSPGGGMMIPGIGGSPR